MSAQHTPGPWSKGRETGIAQVYNAVGELVCDVRTTLADANVIVAAPELLAAAINLEIALAQYSTLPADKAKILHKAIRAAIAKATGAAS